MKYALIGYGKMGRSIEAAATARGHTLGTIVDRAGRGPRVARAISKGSWRGVTIAFFASGMSTMCFASTGSLM